MKESWGRWATTNGDHGHGVLVGVAESGGLDQAAEVESAERVFALQDLALGDMLLQGGGARSKALAEGLALHGFARDIDEHAGGLASDARAVA